jgi:hypothetical protein
MKTLNILKLNIFKDYNLARVNVMVPCFDISKAWANNNVSSQAINNYADLHQIESIVFTGLNKSINEKIKYGRNHGIA